MLKQDTVIKQTNSEVVKIDDEFQNIENIMMRIFNILDESDKLMKIAENELEKIGGEKIEWQTNVKPQNAQLNKVVNVKKQKKNAILNPQRNVIADLLGDYSLLIFVRKGHNQTKLGSNLVIIWEID